VKNMDIKLTEHQERMLKRIVENGGARYHPYWMGNPAYYCYASGAGGTLRMPTVNILIEKGMLEKTAFTKFRDHAAIPTDKAKKYLEERKKP
jgi:hypothetical protein